MDTTIRLSILIPAYNVERLLGRCLDSIFSQNTADIEVIVVNDGSTDHTFQVAEKYARAYTNMRLLTKKNEGVGAVRNMLLDNAHGEFIWFVDSDDYIVENCLSQILDILENTADIDMLGIASNSNGAAFFEGSGISYIQKNYINGYLWSKIIRLSIINDYRVRFVPNRYSQEDWLFLMKIYPHLQLIKQNGLNAYVYCDDNEHSIMRGRHTENTKRNVRDSRETICLFKHFIEEHRSEVYYKTYLAWLNFSAAGYLYSLFPIKYSYDEIRRDIRIFREHGVYPIKKTGRRNADLFLKVANFELIYLFVVKLYRLFKT